MIIKRLWVFFVFYCFYCKNIFYSKTNVMQLHSHPLMVEAIKTK